MNHNQPQLLDLTAQITCAFLSTRAPTAVDSDALPTLISNIYGTLASLGEPAAPAVPEYKPAVDPKRSVKPDAIISLIDGQPYKMLKRHLATHSLTPAEYRARYNLRPDYPMVARTYADIRRDLAKKIGLGRGGHPRGRRRAGK